MGAEDTPDKQIVAASSAKLNRRYSHRKRRPLGGRTKSLSSQKLQCRSVRLDDSQRKVFTVPKIRERYVTQEDIYHLLSDSSKTGNRLSPYAPLPTIGCHARVSTGEERKSNIINTNLSKESKNEASLESSRKENTSGHFTSMKDESKPEVDNVICECTSATSLRRGRTYTVLEPRVVKRPSTESSNDTLVFGPLVGTTEDMQGPIKLWDGVNNLVNRLDNLELDAKVRVPGAWCFN